MKPEERVKCCKRIGILERLCPRWAAVTREGEPYCKQHDPERMKDLAAISVERWQKKHQSERTLSRDTAIKLVEAAESSEEIHELNDLWLAVQKAKRELGI